jgi:hypothetical protein
MTTLESRITRSKASATSRGLIVRLMNYEYDNLLKGGCHYCGASLLNEAGYCLDRVNSNKGYVLNNVVGCCKHKTNYRNRERQLSLNKRNGPSRVGPTTFFLTSLDNTCYIYYRRANVTSTSWKYHNRS